MSTRTLPILDLRDFTTGDATQRAAFVAQLRQTAHHIGFFYLRGFGAGTVVINLGEVLEILTQGYLRATTHRVVSPIGASSRLSVAQASGVDTDPQNPLIAHTGRNLLKGRLRSHPEVTQRFYADVQPPKNAHGYAQTILGETYATP
ncbi:2OG-Fe(II) oxygenase family protein [Rhodoferax saidenbachensis]|uniref:Isopenicillin N synthase-like dioxygenase n=1 Tax=Rhodoferax saidenbachensis TaxID=1484693 RepID=A0ABU1ZPE2_9BURK|nr:2OG-Fe(II) oxygenase family protein [Rhodoferax saidenbachensis]MDR7307419.1 isopenicillin N synthase-like dioxygenase [Rhodoferax saidenbachensis]